MATLADSLVSSSARKLPIRKRPDLSARIQRYQGRCYWVVKEPIGLNYFRFQEEEFAILNMLDGTMSLDEIKDQFESEFPPQKITVEELQQFIGMLHRSGLVITGAPGQGKQLKKRGDERNRKELMGKFTNVLAIRFKGVDPNRLLNWMTPKFRLVFSRLGVAVWFTVCLSALFLVVIQFQVFQSKLPAFHQFFGPQNWFWLAIAMGLTKVCHEFGHGVSCKHFGGECHEIGVMILVLTPCLYCNVSDSWMLPNKWRRAMIGAAGMYVEVFLASVATFIWWFTEPGLLNQISLSTMFVCSVSTVMFNANPLLRYDGYYILADVVEIPNLRAKATKILSTKMGKWCLGLEEPEDPFLPKRNQIFFAIFSVASVMYRWFVMLSILFFLFKVFEPYGLQVIGYMIGSMSIFGLVVMPLWKVGKFFYVPGRIDKVKKGRMYTSMALLAAVILGIVYIPLPFSVMCATEIRPHDARAVYVFRGGKLLAENIKVEPGQKVQEGDILVTLENDDLEQEILQLTTAREQIEAQLDDLRRRSFADRDAQLQIPEVQKSLEGTGRQLHEKLEESDRLTLVAPRDGVVIPPRPVPQRPQVEGGLSGFSGTPFDERNDGAILSHGMEFCRIGDPKQWEAVLVVDQSDIEFVNPKQHVAILLEQMPLGGIGATIHDISPEAMKECPPSLSNKYGGPIATETDHATGRELPQSTHYKAITLPLDGKYASSLRSGLRGEGKISAQKRSIGDRFWRFVNQTFNFSL